MFKNAARLRTLDRLVDKQINHLFGSRAMRRQKQDTTHSAEARVISYGLDVHKKNISVTVVDGSKKPQTHHVHAEEILNFFVRQQREYAGCELRAVYEAGFSGFSLQRKLTALGICTIVINPADIPLTDKQRTQKNDRADSIRLAKALHMGMLTGIWIPDEQTEGDRQFVRHRLHLLKDLSQYRHRIKGFLHRHGVAIPKCYDTSTWSGKFRLWLGEQQFATPLTTLTFTSMLSEYDHRLAMYKHHLQAINTLASTPRYASAVNLLRSIPGIGRLTAITILTEIGSISRFRTVDRFASYIGLVPMQYQSGSTDRDMPIQRRAQQHLRRMLIQCGWIGARIDQRMRSLFERKKAHKPSTKAVIVVARHQLNYVYAVLKQQRPYQAIVAASIESSDTTPPSSTGIHEASPSQKTTATASAATTDARMDGSSQTTAKARQPVATRRTANATQT